jgi:hypothetical protein
MVIKPGRYFVEFKTSVGQGGGIVEFGTDGKLHGGDQAFAFDGTWTQDGGRFRAALFAKRVVPGPPGVFGMDELDIVLSGQTSGGSSILCAGFAKQTPGLNLDVVLIRAKIQ